MVVSFLGFATVRKFTAAIGEVPEVDLPVSKTASMPMITGVGDRQKAAKK